MDYDKGQEFSEKYEVSLNWGKKSHYDLTILYSCQFETTMVMNIFLSFNLSSYLPAYLCMQSSNY